MKITPSDIDRGFAALASATPSAELEALETATDLPPAALVLRGRARYAAGRFEGAIADFDAVLAIEKENPIARLHRGLARFRVGNRKGAMTDWRGGPLFPQRDFLRAFLRLFWPLHFQEPALLGGLLSKVPKTFPERTRAEAGLGRPAGDKQRLADARALHKAGVKAFLSEHVAQSYALLEQAALLDPQSFDIGASWAWCLLHTGQGQRAGAFLSPWIEAGLEHYANDRDLASLPHPHAMCLYAWSLHECGRHREALALLSTVLPEGPEDHGAHIVAAVCWLMLGDDAKFDACFDRAFADFFLDTWDFFLRPFVARTLDWLGESAG